MTNRNWEDTNESELEKIEQTPIWDFEVNSSITFYLNTINEQIIKANETQSERKANLYNVDAKIQIGINQETKKPIYESQEFAFWGNTLLNKLMSKCDKDTQYTINYLGMQKTKDGLNEFRNFELFKHST